MINFNNDTYEALVKDLLNDAFYLDDRSARGKIATIRQYSEVIVRRILAFSSEKSVTLGNKKILNEIITRSKNNRLLLDSLENIRIIGNRCIHTQTTEAVTDNDVNSAINSLFNLYSYLLIDYFERYEFGSNLRIISSFSILPPIIRYIVLNFLNEQHPENLFIIDKLSLAILKAYSKEKAIEWIEARKDTLKNTHSITTEAKEDINKKLGKAYAEEIISQAPNMYDLCINRIKRVNSIIEEKGKLYDDFESATELYQQVGKVEGETPEIIDFNSIMEFLYLGRRARKNDLLNEKNAYFIIDNI